MREAEFGPRTVVVYTSDHGEQFREHNQLGHTASVFDVELHVPTWIDAPAGTITTREREALASYRDASVFHTDLTPTMLDLMGLLEAPAVAPYRVNMVGSSLLRGEYPERTVALTNCTGVWGCVFQNWGLMRGSRKLHAREWDGAWLCYDVARDPGELNPLPLDRCANLVTEAERIYPSVPGQP